MQDIRERAPFINDRYQILDVLRGFALLGILLDNMYGFTGFAFLNPSMREALPTHQTDKILDLGELILVHGKFYSLFSLLFGIGFSVILKRSEQKGIDPVRFFYRRLFILLLIGAAHIFLLWEGDILFLYALTGFLLPLFRKCSDRNLLIWSIALLFSPVLIDLIKVLLNIRTGTFLHNAAVASDIKNGIPTDDSFADYLFKSGSGWKEWWNWKASGYLYRFADFIETNRMPKVLGMFVMGLYAGRKMLYANLENNRDFFRKLRNVGLGIGIPLNVAIAFFQADGKRIPHVLGLADTILYAAAVVPLCLGYVGTICLIWIHSGGNTFLRWMAPAGQMALTNYLMQTIIGVLLFYNVGFGWGGNVGPSIFFPVALGIFMLQVILSRWWMKRFNFGPLEWIWRQLTYGKALPLIKKR